MARVAFIVDEMFEDSEFRVPFDAIEGAGHEVFVIGRDSTTPLKGKRGEETVLPDVSIRDAAADEYDALVIPGGYSPDMLRMNEGMVELTRAIFDAGKPLAAVCHAGWMLAEAKIAKGRTLTSWPSIKTDLINAGARWVDREVVEDGNLITSRKPDDLQAFTAAILRQLESKRASAEARPA